MPIFWLLFLLLFPAPAEAICVSGSCHTTIGQIALPHQPVKDGECLSCHLQQQQDHPASRGKTFTFNLTGAELCYQCHGIMGKLAVVHPPVKKGECLSCHRPHGTANRFLLDTGADRSSLCFGCHERSPFTGVHAHGPAAAGACNECHRAHESSEKKLLASPPTTLCFNCHVDFVEGIKKAAVVHSPLQKSPCTSCHLPHSSENPSLLSEKMPDLCLKCHSALGERLKTFRIQHAPLQQAGGCGSCHLSHYGENKGLLLSDEKSICLTCHGSNGNSSLKNIRKQMEKKKVLHGPLNEGKCSPCHDPHGGNSFRLLTGRYPAGAYELYEPGDYDFCLQCHDKNLLRFRNTTIYTRFRDGDVNLHYIHVAGQRKGRTCRFCHEPHGSTGPKLISNEGMSFGKWDIPIRFEITPTGGSCAPGCHRPIRYDREAAQNPPATRKK